MEEPTAFKTSFLKKEHSELIHFECPICLKKYENQVDVETHVSTHITSINIPQNECVECNLTFDDQKSFDSHMIYHSSRPYQCDVCKYSFKRKTHLDRHTEIHIKNATQYQCVVCLQKGMDKGELQEHLENHLNSDCNKCEACNLKFENMEAFKSHINGHDTRPHSCSICNKTFKYSHHLGRHKREVHIENKNCKPFGCDVCANSFMRKVHLERHMRTHENNDTGKSFQCDVCNTCYMTSHHLKQHMKFHSLLEKDEENERSEKTNDRPYNCDLCDSKFKTRYHLHRHMKAHKVSVDNEQLNIKYAICKNKIENKNCGGIQEQFNNSGPEVCEKQSGCDSENSNMGCEESKPKIEINKLIEEFPNADDTSFVDPDFIDIADLVDVQNEFNSSVLVKTEPYEIGIETDEIEKVTKEEIYQPKKCEMFQLTSQLRFVCDICQEPFTKKSALVNHKKTHKGFKEDEGFKCEGCGKSFETRRRLNVHLRTHFQKQFICEVCKKEFRTQQNLVLHMKIHSAIKDFGCIICQKRFRTKQHLLIHGRVHLKEQGKKTPETDSMKILKLSTIKKEIDCNSDESELPKDEVIDVANKYLTETFQCEFCGKNFSTKQNMQLHLKIHLDIKDFICDICDKGFRTKQQLNVHKNKHKDKITVDSLQLMCDFCKKVFSTKQNLSLHLKIHLDIRDFVCVVCNKGFRTKQQLKNHEKVHKNLNKKEAKLLSDKSRKEKSENLSAGQKRDKGAVEELLMEISNIEEMLECRIDTDTVENKTKVSLL